MLYQVISPCLLAVGSQCNLLKLHLLHVTELQARILCWRFGIPQLTQEYKMMQSF